MKEDQNDRVRRWLREAVPPVSHNGPQPDLWLKMQARLRAVEAQEGAAPPWYDWALAAAVAVFALFAPVSIPVLLYYL